MEECVGKSSSLNHVCQFTIKKAEYCGVILIEIRNNSSELVLQDSWFLDDNFMIVTAQPS
jgi:hypothetical protein